MGLQKKKAWGAQFKGVSFSMFVMAFSFVMTFVVPLFFWCDVYCWAGFLCGNQMWQAGQCGNVGVLPNL